MITQLARAWPLVALRGVLAVVFGIVAFAWPGMTLYVLVLWFGAFMLVDGIIAIAQAVRARHERERWPTLLAEGALGVIVGGLCLAVPGLAAVAWLYTIAAWAVITGILAIVLAVRLRREIKGEIWVALTGLLSVVLGIALVAMPLAGLLAWIYLLGAYAIVTGVVLIAFAFRLRRELHGSTPGHFTPTPV